MLNDGAKEVIDGLLKDAPLLETALIARATTTEELIDLLVTGFRAILEKDSEDSESPDFTNGPINAYSFYLPVVMLLQDPEYDDA